MAKREEQALLYQFPDEQISAAQETCRRLGIRMKVLPVDAWREKVGYLLGRKGYRPAENKGSAPFAFPHRVLLLEYIQGKRLGQVLAALEAAGIPRVAFKSVITPYNTLWTLGYLCEHMAKEHGMASDREEQI